MSFSHGKLANVQIGDATNTLVDISVISNSCDIPRTLATGETTHFGDTAKEFIGGIEDGTVSIAGLYDNVLDGTIQAAVDSIVNGTNQNLKLQYGPQGNATGKVKYTLNVVWTTYSVSTPVGGVATFKLDGQRTGPTVRAVFP
jgi:hypothetical protein